MTHFHGGNLLFYGRDSFLWKYSFIRSRLVSKAGTNEWVASNRILVLAQRFVGSPRGEHCNSPENGRFNHLYVHIFCRVPGISLFMVQNPLCFSRQTITWPRDFLLHRFFHPSKEQQLGKNNFHLRWRRLWGGIFSDIAICLFNTLPSMKTGCTYKASCFRAIYGKIL